MDWLNELVHLLFASGKLPAEFAFESAGPSSLACRVSGPLLGDAGLSPEVKAATYHGLRVIEDQGRVSATVILDV